MTLKTLQWNIGGGWVRSLDADPAAPASYDTEDLAHIIDVIREADPDIITLQETHAREGRVQAELIAKRLGYPVWVNDAYDQSHIDPTEKLCQSVITRFHLRSHAFSLFLNPHWVEPRKNWTTHDKGMTTCDLDALGGVLRVQTFHAVPFRGFDISPASDQAKPVIASMNEHIAAHGAYLLQADTNIDATPLADFFDAVGKYGLSEVPVAEPTTPRGRRYDRILYRALRLTGAHIDADVLTDHYPVIATFEVENTPNLG